MKSKLYLSFLAFVCAFSLLATGSAEAYQCRWVNGHWNNGYFHQGHRVCWGGGSGYYGTGYYHGNRYCGWRHGERVCWYR